jgi:hypothetical protein
VTRHWHGTAEDLAADLTTVVRHTRRHWSVATIVPDPHPDAGRDAGQGGAEPAMVRPVALLLRPVGVLPLGRRHPAERVGAVTERVQPGPD